MTSLIAAIVLVLQGATAASQSGVITGQVRNNNGTPASNVRVAVMDVKDISSGVEVLAVVGETNAAGSYRLEGIPPGRYVVTAGALVVPTYYPGVKTSAEARTLTVLTADTVSGIDFQLLQKPVRVSGRLSGLPSGAPAGLYSAILSVFESVVSVDVQADGTFVFPQVEPGRHRITIYPGDAGATRPLEVTDKDIEIDFKIDGVNLWGKAVIEEGGEIPAMPIRFGMGDPQSLLILLLEVVDSSPQRGEIINVRPNGLFRVKLPAGVPRRVSLFRIPIGLTVSSLSYGSIDLLKSPFQITDPPAANEIRMSLTSKPPETVNWQTIRGHVPGFRENSATPTWVMVTGVRFDEPRGGKAQVRPDGTFEIRNVPAGTYYFSAVNHVGSEGNRVTVEVGDVDIDGVALQLPK